MSVSGLFHLYSLYSRAIVGYYLSMDHPGSMEIALALYHAFLEKPQPWWIMHGIPSILYVDNGKEWVSKHIEVVCLDFGIQLLAHEPYHPQSKGKVERGFRSLEDLCVHPLDGSVGSNLRTRPNKITPRYTLEEVRIKIERHFKEYHERKHGTTKERPYDRWNNDVTVIRGVSDFTVIDKLLKSKPYIIQRDGIHFKGGRYRDPEHILAGYIGRKVTVFYNPRDTSCIRAWGTDETGTFRFLCTAYPREIAEIPSDRDAIMEENKRRRDLVREGVRAVQQEGKQVLKQLAVDEAERDAEAQQSIAQADSAATVPPPAAGLLESKRPMRTSRTEPVIGNSAEGAVDMDALRRQLIRARRNQQ